MEEKQIKYILFKAPLGDLQDMCIKAQNMGEYNMVVYDHKIDRSYLSPEQQVIQQDNKWSANTGGQVYTSTEHITEAIKQIVYNNLNELGKENLQDEIYNKIKSANVIVSASINNSMSDIHITTDIEPCIEEGYEYSTDVEEFERRAVDVCHKGVYRPYNRVEDATIYIEEVKVDIPTYRYVEILDELLTLTKKFIRENLTYCTKDGKFNVPEEYIARGKEGIDEWRSQKKTANKNNSIEKQILRDVIHNKKKFALDKLDAIMFKIAATNSDWSIPTIEIEGRYNHTKAKKLLTKLFEGKSKQDIIDITEEEIIKLIKEYWKEKLMDAYKAVDKIRFEEE